MAKLDTLKSFFKDTAIGGGLFGLGSAILCTIPGGLVCNRGALEKIGIPVCTFYGLFHNQYPRFDDKVHLGFTVLASCYALYSSYKYYSQKCNDIDEDYKYLVKARGKGLDKTKKQEARWFCITALPETAAIFSLIATAGLELSRYAASCYNER